MKSLITLVFALLLSGLMPVAAAEGHAELLQRYASEAGVPLSAERGKALWENRVGEKSCTNCHKSDITQPGEAKILFFTKSIKPMALSANPERYQDAEKADKAFDKNCKRVFNRLCSSMEKGDLLSYLVGK